MSTINEAIEWIKRCSFVLFLSLFLSPAGITDDGMEVNDASLTRQTPTTSISKGKYGSSMAHRKSGLTIHTNTIETLEKH